MACVLVIPLASLIQEALVNPAATCLSWSGSVKGTDHTPAPALAAGRGRPCPCPSLPCCHGSLLSLRFTSDSPQMPWSSQVLQVAMLNR